MEHKKTPWLKADGTLKSKSEIKRSCENWSPQIWEEYLKTLDVDLEEILFDDPVCVEDYSQKEHEDHKNSVFTAQEFPVLKKYLFNAVKELNHKQQRILNCLFLESLNLQEIGENMGISKGAVSRMKDRALKNLGLILMKLIFPRKSKMPKEKKEAC